LDNLEETCVFHVIKFN